LISDHYRNQGKTHQEKWLNSFMKKNISMMRFLNLHDLKKRGAINNREFDVVKEEILNNGERLR